MAILPEYAKNGTIRGYSHPYEFELDNFEPSVEQLQVGEVCKPPKLNETPLVGVDEIAVDVSNTQYRTYLGMIWLLQLSTRQIDYVIDALVLRDKLQNPQRSTRGSQKIKHTSLVFLLKYCCDIDIEKSLLLSDKWERQLTAERETYARQDIHYLLWLKDLLRQRTEKRTCCGMYID